MKPILLRPDPTPRAAEYARMLALELCDRGVPLAGPEETDLVAVLFVCGAVTPGLLEETEAALERYRCPILCCAAEASAPLPSGVIFAQRPLDVKHFCDNLAAAALDDAIPVPTAPVSAAPEGIVLDRLLHRVTCRGEPIGLTEREYQLLALLDEHRGQPVSREEAARRVWGTDTGTNVVDVYVRYLRKKLDERFDARFLVTVRGQGYLLKEG